MNAGETHESLASGRAVEMGSERGFGLVFAVVFGLIGIWPALTLGWRPQIDPTALRWWSLVIASVFLAAALLYPSLLAPFNRGWFKFGLLLSKVMTPIVMGIVFVLTVVPTALIRQLWGNDSLGRKIDRAAKSYWIRREPPGPARDTMRNQF